MAIGILKNNKLNKKCLKKIIDLLMDCFKNDIYYKELLKSKENKEEIMGNMFRHAIDFCMSTGEICYVSDKNTPVAVLLTFDYYKALNNHKEDFYKIFNIKEYSDMNKIILREISEFKKLKWILLIAVKDNYRRSGIASKLIQDYILLNKDENIAVDISNQDSLKIYDRLGFLITKIEDGYFLAIKKVLKNI